jgi:LacI family transcriptional regulator
MSASDYTTSGTARSRRSPAAGKAHPGGAPTLQQVADEAGVSLATASRVLNGSTRIVNPELSDHVRAVATRLRYVSHGPAQALARATTSLVGLLVHDVNDPYFSAIAAGAMRVARANDLLVMVASTHREAALEADYVARLGAQRARAILLAGSPPTDPDAAEELAENLRTYLGSGGRVVSIGDQGPDIDAVLPANAQGAHDAALHLTALGHERIGVITGPAGLVAVADRLEGFRRGLIEGGEAFGSAPCIEADFTRDGGYAAAQRLLETRPDLTAIFALNDVMAIGALAALRDAGRRVPEDVSVIGYDDLSIAADVTPALTTVRLELETMGEQAMRMVLGGAESSQLAGVVTDGGRRVVRSATRLIIRASTGPVGR